MIGILEAEREAKRKQKYLEQLRRQNRSQTDDDRKKLEFIQKFCKVS